MAEDQEMNSDDQHHEPEIDLGHAALDGLDSDPAADWDTDHEKILHALEEEAELAREQQEIEEELRREALAEIEERHQRHALDIQSEQYGED